MFWASDGRLEDTDKSSFLRLGRGLDFLRADCRSATLVLGQVNGRDGEKRNDLDIDAARHLHSHAKRFEYWAMPSIKLYCPT